MGISIKSSDLKYEYSKNATNGDNPKVIGNLDSSLFNRNEEYEIINLLNKVMNELKLKNKRDLHKLEDMIQDDLPGKIRKLDDVFDWLVDNF